MQCPHNAIIAFSYRLPGFLSYRLLYDRLTEGFDIGSSHLPLKGWASISCPSFPLVGNNVLWHINYCGRPGWVLPHAFSFPLPSLRRGVRPSL